MQTELYFGLSKKNGEIISDSAWNGFVQKNFVKVFPAGFTELTAQGKWFDSSRRELTTEPSHIITVVYKNSEEFSAKIDRLRNCYKDLFQQQSVLRVDKEIKAGF